MVAITDPLIVNDRTEKPISQITVGFTYQLQIVKTTCILEANLYVNK
jgi:hypothetical protein